MSQPVQAPSFLFRPPTVPDRQALIFREWKEGAEPDTRAVLDRHPEWEADKPFVQDLVLEEFCLRSDRGETVNIDAFAARFPLYRTSLRRMLSAHQFIERNGALLEQTVPQRWPEVGESLGDLTLQSEIGRGAFARVFLAKENSTGGRTIVAKVSYDGQHEALTLGPLSHPHIIPVLSAALDEKTRLSVVRMPYHGRATLADLIDRSYPEEGAAPPRSPQIVFDVAKVADETESVAAPPEPHAATFEDGILRLVRQIARALAFLHEKGICHRDIKPSNVLLNPKGHVLLLDFNLSADGSLPPARLGGTLPYMAPEQLRAMNDRQQPPPGPAADVFALGVIAYELLTGHHPFGPVPLASPMNDLASLLVVRHQTGPAPLRSFNRRVGSSFAEFLTRCLAVEAKERPTAAQLVEAVERHFSLSRRMGRWIVRRPFATAAGVLVAAALGVGANELARMRFPAPVPPLSSAKEEAQRLYQIGRDRLQRNDFEAAYRAFGESDSKLSDGRALACMAYAKGMDKNHAAAIDHASEAIARGLKGNARIRNNRGYGHMMRFVQLQDARNANSLSSTFDAALADFDEAIRLDPDLQAAYYNRAKLALRRALTEPSWAVPESAFEDIRKAIALGPVSRALAADAARLFALAAKKRPALRGEALQYAVLAINKGHDANWINSELLLKSYKEEPSLRDALAAKPTVPPSVPELQLIDPLPDKEPVAAR